MPVVEEEFERLGVVGVARKGSSSLAAATILAHGSDAQKEKFLRRILTGEDAWCQLFSEPGSGSDLAGATTRAELNGDHYVINGQKVWNTSAHHADYGILLARTNFDVLKHQGLSYFLLPMRQPGVEVRPLRQMNGHASFNEVFFTDAQVPREFMLESEGDGWKVATTTLMHERRYADSMRRETKPSERPGRIYREEAEEAAIALEPTRGIPSGRVAWI
jgi:alkylation response protein AidB-like acyl-CoA dehydrogenase